MSEIKSGKLKMSAQKNNGPIIDPALCRCCRAIKKCRVLTAEYNWMGKKEVYADMVMDCYGILLSHVDDNEKDSGVCATCVVRLREAIAFRHQVLQCEELFLQAKLAPPEEETNSTTNYESKLKKLELESLDLKTEPKDYNSDHNSMDLDDRDDALPTYSDDEDNKPLKPESKPSEPPLKDQEVKSEDSEDYNGSSSDSDEPIKKKSKRKVKAKANGAKKKPAKAKKQKADTAHTQMALNEEIIIKEEFKMEFSESDEDRSVEGRDTVPVEFDMASEIPLDVEGKRKRRPWIRETTDSLSEFEQLESQGNEDLYFSYFNMSKSSFEELHEMIRETIDRAEYMRKCISTKEKLAICLRHLRGGHSHLTLASRYIVGVTTVSKVVKVVSRALWSVLQPIYMPTPREHTWRQAEAGYRDTWNFPNCVGSIGGKHIIAKHKKDSEYPKASEIASQSKFVSIALLAVTDPDHKIVALDIGNYAKDGDGHILENSKFYSKYMDNKDFLPPKPLPGETGTCPYVLINDGSFMVKHNLLRPYPKLPKPDDSKKTFNRWLNRACTVSRTFQMLMDSWAILHRPMETQVETAVAALKAICCLHNFILTKHGKTYPFDTDVKIKTGGNRGRKKLKGLKPFKPASHRSSNAAIAVRDKFVAYINRMDPSELKYIVGSADDVDQSNNESLQSNNLINVPVELLNQPDDLINVPVELVNQPNEMVSEPVETLLQRNEMMNVSVERLHETNELIVPVELVNQPNESVETLHQPNEMVLVSIERLYETNESIDLPVELVNQSDGPVETLLQTNEMVNVPVETLLQTNEMVNVPAETLHETNESINVDD